MKRLPLVPTLIVTLAVPVMVALGIWQLQRAEWKQQLLARLEATAQAPLIAKPPVLKGREAELSFRRVRATCTEIRPWQPSAGRTTAGATGYRQQIWCREGQGEPILVSLGVAADPSTEVAVAPGAAFTGRLVPRDGLPSFLLIAEHPVPPLAAEAPPSLDTIPNSHMAYAIQWFAFAGVLTAIYLVYLRRRIA